MHNLAGRSRRGWVSFTVPAATVTDPAIELWPHGWPAFWGERVGPSARLVHVRCGEIPPRARVFGLLVGRRPSGGGNLGGGPAAGGRIAPPELRIGQHTWQPTAFHQVESGPARSVFYAFGRPRGSKLVVQMWFYLYPASRIIPFELMVAHCDQSTTEMVADVPHITLRTVPGLYPAIDFLEARGGSAPKSVAGKIVTKLHGPTWFRHGQGAAWSGRLLVWEGASREELQDLLAAHQAPIVGMALNWHGHWGPWGVLPEPHPKASSSAMLTVRRQHEDAFATAIRSRGDLWRLWRFGLRDRPAGTGAQNDFGASKFAPLFYWKDGNPFHLWQVLPSVLREAGRNSYFYEADGSPLDLARHPRWATWGYRTHYHSSKSPDQLGKQAFDTTRPNTLFNKDFAHASSNTLAGWTILTASHLGRHLCRQEITCAVAWDRSFGLGEERAWGRVPLSLVWNHLATGDDRVFPAFRDVVDHGRWSFLIQSIAKRWDVRLFGYSGPDARYFNGKYSFWTPWHQGLAITGLDAMALRMNPPNLKLEWALLELCRSHVLHGWAKLGGRWRVGAAVRWMGGRGLTAAEKNDREYFTPDDGTNFRNWCWPAVRIAMRRLAYDPVLASRAREIDAALQREWRASEPKKIVGDLGRTSEWSAVR